MKNTELIWGKQEIFLWLFGFSGDYYKQFYSPKWNEAVSQINTLVVKMNNSWCNEIMGKNIQPALQDIKHNGDNGCNLILQCKTTQQK